MTVSVGERFGRLRLLCRAPRDVRTGKTRWFVVCDCGRKKIVLQNSLVSGCTRSCGCLHIERTRRQGHANRRHGEARLDRRSLEYQIWLSMRQRCFDSRNRNFRRYGARGIRICRRWNSFENFLVDMGRKPSPKHSIDRIDNNGNYEPKNCRWATPRQQAQNRRNNRLITFRGETLPVTEWCRKLKLVPDRVWARLYQGWSFEEAIAKPARRYGGAPCWCGKPHLARGLCSAHYARLKQRGLLSRFEEGVGRLDDGLKGDFESKTSAVERMKKLYERLLASENAA